MNIGLIKRLGEQHPEVLELLAEWQSLSKQHDGLAVALMRKELAEFDKNHTRVSARLADCLNQLGDRIDSSAIYARDLQKRVQQLEIKVEKHETTGPGQEETQEEKDKASVG